jgi:hypothetical protein
MLYIGVFDNVTTHRRARPGGERVRGLTGGEDTWLVGFDYELAGDLRWIPKGASVTSPWNATGWSGPTGVQAFLDWARGANAFRFLPDASVPDFYVTSYLMEANEEPRHESSDLAFQITMRIRNTTVDYGLAWRGLMFEYAPGLSLTDPAIADYTRATTGTFRKNPVDLPSTALGASAASGVLRDRHYIGGSKTTLLEASRIQLVTDPVNMGSGNWSAINTPTRTGGQTDPFGGTEAWDITDNDAGLSEGYGGAITALSGSDGVRSLAVFMRPVTFNIEGSFALRDNVAVINRLLINAEWASLDAIPVVTVSNGTLLHQEYYGDGWWLFICQTTSCTIANSHTVHCRIGANVASDQGTIRFYMANLWNVAVPGSPQGAALGTRNADSLGYPFAFKPQPMFLYLKFVELGTLLDAVAIQGGYCEIGSTSEAAPTLRMFCGTAFNYQLDHFNGSGSNVATSTGGYAAAAYGKLVEWLCLLKSDGSVQFHIEVNGVPASTGGSAGLQFANAWSAPTLIHIGRRGTAIGLAGFQDLKVGPYIFNGRTIDSLAKARAI